MGITYQFLKGSIVVMMMAVLAIILFCVGTHSASAAITTNALTTVTTFQQTIKASSPFTAVLGLNLAQSSSETLSSVKIGLNPSASFTIADLNTLASSSTSGMALFRDNKVGGVRGSFDATDTQATFSAAPTYIQSTQFSKITPTATAGVANTTMNIATGSIVFANISAGGAPTTGYTWHMVTKGNQGSGGVAASTLRLDGATSAPTYVSSTQFSKVAPASSASYTINGSSNTTSPALATGDVVFLQTGTTAGRWAMVTGSFSASNSPINGANLANATYSISKLSASATGAFVVSGTSAITGNYSSPAVGDIVLYQSGTASASWGIITNATLTSGTFAINGAALGAGTWQITKVATYGATTATTTDTSMSITAGDLMLGLTTNNPQSSSVAWHIATAGGTGTTSTALRLDGAAGAPVYGYVVTINLSASQTIPADDTAGNAGADYFIVVRTASGATNGHGFSVGVGPGDLTFSSNNPTATPTAVTSATWVVDTVAPTFDSTRSGPSNNATGVPVSTFVNVAFSEVLDQTTLTSSNVTFTSGGSAVPAMIKPLPDAFNVVVSSPPTYATDSVYARVASTTYGVFQMIGTSPVVPQGGTYTAPVNGDIVFFQHDTFPPEVGLITNSTLTSGTFACNGFNLFGNQTIIKFKTPDVTGAVSGTGSITTGDIVVANLTADGRYAWHLATTGAAANSSNLRLDSAGAQPSFTSGTSFSAIHPTTTTSVDASSKVLGATDTALNFTVGDLVFAKISAGGDNLGAYTWHVVTTAQNVTTDVAPATLRLDGATTAPTFVASTRISKLTPGTQGSANGSGVDTSTNFSYGDIIFAKPVTNAASAGAYTFHLVSSPAAGIANVAIRLDNSAGNLNPSTNYVVTAGVGIKDRAGNALASPVTISFTTGSTNTTNVTPPSVQTTSPQSGNQSFSPNASISIQFSVPMATSGAGSVLNSSNIGVFVDNFGAPGAQITAVNTYNSTTQTVTIKPSANLSVSTGYIVKIASTTQSANNITMPEYRLSFRTASAVDTTAPTIAGVYPGDKTGGIPINLTAVGIGFSEDMLSSSITGTTVTLSGGITGTVTYNPGNHTAFFSPTAPLAKNTTYTVTVTTGVKDLAGNALASQYTSTFTTANTDDTTKPTVVSTNADNFGLAVTFSEAMKSGGGPAAVDNIANYTLESPTGSSINLAGKTVTYDGPTMTAKISGISLQNGNSFKVTVANVVQDLSANGIDTSGSPANNIAVGTVANASTTSGQLGPGSGPTQDAGQAGMNPIRITPRTKVAGATTSYNVAFPVSTSIPSGGSIVLTFPMGFNVSSISQAAPGTTSFCNSDLNGPATGAVTIASVTGNYAARTITIVTAGAATTAPAFLCMDLLGIVNSTIPNSAGYTVDIKTRDASNTILETKTSSPFFLGQLGRNKFTVTVFNDNGAGGGTAGDNIKNGSEAAIQNARVFLFSPAAGGNDALTNSSGVATFTSLSNDTYMFGVDPFSVASTSGGNFILNSAPQAIAVSASVSKNYGIRASALNITGTITGPANTKVDVFGMSGTNGFTKATVQLNGSGTNTYTLPVQASTSYSIGVGPSVPEAFALPGALPPPPTTFSFMPPPNQTVRVLQTSVSGINFTLTTADKTITGTVVDANGNAISNAGVFARPVQTSTTSGSSSAVGFGTSAQTGTDGSFTLSVTAGTYSVGVFKPGMPTISDQQITVNSDGSKTPSTLRFVMAVSSSITITGKITDTSNNAIPYSGVSARKVTSTSDTTPIGGGKENFIFGQADSNGSYTLYVSSGTWVLEAFAPGYGDLGKKTVSVTTSLTGQDFSASTLSLGTITGSATKNSVAQQGVMVRADGPAGSNTTITDASGAYSLKVPVGTYTVTCFFPGVGDTAPVTGITVTNGGTTSGNDCTMGASITITVNLTDGTNAITSAYVDVRDANGRGNGTDVATTSGANGVYTVSVPPGTYTVRAGNQLYGTIGTTSNVNSTRTISYTATAGVTYNVTGTVTSSGSGVNSAWVSVFGTPSGQTNMINVGGATNSSGAFTIAVPAGSYKLRVDKPGYTSPSATTVTVTNAAVAVGTISLTAASHTISGTVSLNGSGVSNAFVDASDGAGGFAVAQTDANGAYSLSVDNGTWSVNAHSIGYQAGPLTVVVNGNSPSSQNLGLSAISGYIVKAQKEETVTPTSGGILTNSDLGSNFKLNIPANATGTSSNAATVATQPNTALPNAVNAKVFNTLGFSVSATDSSNNPIKSLNSSATITVSYASASLPSGASEANLVLGVYNTTTNAYDTLPTTVDTANKTLTATVTHFSDFAPLLPTAGAPDTPTGLTGKSGSEGTSVTLNWTAVSGAATYDVYDSTDNSSFPLVNSTTATSYTVSGLTTGTTYYFKVTALNSSGNESAATSAVSATPAVSTPAGNSSGGGGASSYSSSGATSTPAPTVSSVPTPAPSASPLSTATLAPIIPVATFTQLSIGSIGNVVKDLQNALTSFGLLHPVDVIGIFGPKTKAAVRTFQKTHRLKVTGVVDSVTAAALHVTAATAAPPTVSTPPRKQTQPATKSATKSKPVRKSKKSINQAIIRNVSHNLTRR